MGPQRRRGGIGIGGGRGCGSSGGGGADAAALWRAGLHGGAVPLCHRTAAARQAAVGRRLQRGCQPPAPLHRQSGAAHPRAGCFGRGPGARICSRRAAQLCELACPGAPRCFAVARGAAGTAAAVAAASGAGVVAADAGAAAAPAWGAATGTASSAYRSGAQLRTAFTAAAAAAWPATRLGSAASWAACFPKAASGLATPRAPHCFRAFRPRSALCSPATTSFPNADALRNIHFLD